MNINIDVPCGVSGNWAVEDFEVSKKDADFYNMRVCFSFGNRTIKSGNFKKLTHNGQIVMSNTSAEISDHLRFIRRAKRGGHILINGLGLGVVLSEILKSEAIRSVTIIENSIDVILLVSPTYLKDSRVDIISADAFKWTPPPGLKYAAVWHDIWNDICTDNLSEMTKLHRKYGKRTDWQSSWCKELCRRYYKK